MCVCGVWVSFVFTRPICFTCLACVHLSMPIHRIRENIILLCHDLGGWRWAQLPPSVYAYD